MQKTEKELYLIWWLITCFHKGALRTQHIKLKHMDKADLQKVPQMILRKKSLVHLQLTVEYNTALLTCKELKEFFLDISKR